MLFNSYSKYRMRDLRDLPVRFAPYQGGPFCPTDTFSMTPLASKSTMSLAILKPLDIYLRTLCLNT